MRDLGAPRVLLAFLACVPRDLPKADTDGPFVEGTPAIEALSWACDPGAARWTFEARTDAWTGGGKLWVARTVDDIEKHRVYSDSAAGDGSWDCLVLDLDVVADWRDAEGGTSIRWHCSDALELSFTLQVDDPRGATTTDCRTWGADPALWAESDDVPDCEKVEEFEVTTTSDTGDTGGESGYSAGEVEGCG
ncbi:MAG: hypothetical protein QME96_13540 [Myxococcota bacterium]|nr:hypothetical protein [Myxococcota bacterium]